MMKNSKLYAATTILVMMGFSCKKNEIPQADLPISPTEGTRMQFTLDSIYLYAKQIYLWNDALPDYDAFNPRAKYGGISPELMACQTELYDISQFKVNPVTLNPYELSEISNKPKYSYLENGNTIAGGVANVVGGNGKAVLKASVIDAANIKVAYLALGAFPPLGNCKTELDDAFVSFSSANLNTIIIDLRSNTGGYVETAEYIANLIAPTTLNNKIMFTEAFNSTMQTGNAKILTYQPYFDQSGKVVVYKGRNATMADVDYTETGNTYKYNKQGKLEGISAIYFLVSAKTASASELLISVFKPYLNVKLIGQTTYGKPVGFFGINIHLYSIYFSSFLIKNSQGWFDYFNGMQPDIMIESETNIDFGNPNERGLSAALGQINGKGGVSVSSNQKMMSIKTSLSNQVFVNDKEVVGMIEDRLKLKP